MAFSVRPTGLEPALRKQLDPKSSASTNSATGAKAIAKVTKKTDPTNLLMIISSLDHNYQGLPLNPRKMGISPTPTFGSAAPFTSDSTEQSLRITFYRY